MVRGLSDLEIEFNPTTDLAGVESVIDRVHPAFQWPSHLPLDELSPRVLDLAVKRASDRIHLAHLLDRMLPAAQAEERASAEGHARLEKESEAANAKRAGGLVQILRPTSPRIEDLKGYGKLSAWANDLLIDLLAYRSGDVAWADIDGGCLAAGGPGTGKTLFATALAASAGLPLIVFSYADAQSYGDGHLGTVIKRIKAVFAEAAKAAPCILFIDELDAFSSRSSGLNSGRHDDWWTAIIACLLELLDGTARREGIVVIGATNHPEKIDPAILRSGRLDRRFDIELPDEEALIGIFAHHLPGVPAEAFEPAAVVLSGSISGADVARYAREARRAARRAGRELVVDDLLAVAMPSDTRTVEHQRLVATHEAGHVIACLSVGVVPQSVSIVSSGGNHGGVRSNPSMGLERAGDVEDYVVRLLGGRAAEDVVFGDVCAGSGGSDLSDLAGATRIVQQMLGHLGLGPRLSTYDPPAALVEAEMQRIYARTLDVIRRHREDLEALAELLLEKRVLSQSALQAFASDRGIGGAR